jgi:hypothetical protein
MDTQNEAIIQTPPNLSKVTKQQKTPTKSFPKNTYPPDIATKYNSNYYFMRTTIGALQQQVGPAHFPLFIQNFIQAPAVKMHLPPVPQVVAPTPTVISTNSLLVQNALTLRNNCISMVRSLPNKSHYCMQIMSGLVKEIPTADCVEMFGGSSRSIQRTRKVEFKDTEIGTRKYAPNTTRRCIS